MVVWPLYQFRTLGKSYAALKLPHFKGKCIGIVLLVCPLVDLVEFFLHFQTFCAFLADFSTKCAFFAFMHLNINIALAVYYNL